MNDYKKDRREYKVTSLEDDGSEGTLRYGIKIKEPVYITFSVGGTINLNSRLWINYDYCTIDGETAPSPVIITGDMIYIRSNNTTIRFLTICANRTDVIMDSVWILLASSVLVEHCTIFGGSDEIISATKSENVTIRNCIIGNPLLSGHGFGTILSGVDDHSINYCQDNLFVNCTGRTPNVGIGNVVISGNRVYNYGHLLSYTTNHRDSVILQTGNIYRKGPQTIRENIFIFPSRPSRVTVLLENNILEGNVEGTENNKLLTRNSDHGIFLEYNTGNGRLKIIPDKDVYISKKEYKKLYHR